jgi:hypothetical protein
MLELQATEVTMRRVNRTDWMEWLDALAISGSVEIAGARECDGPMTFLAADFDPFDDTIEILLSESGARTRILLDSPREIWVDGSDDTPDRVLIGCVDQNFEMRRRSSVPRRGKAHLTAV